LTAVAIVVCPDALAAVWYVDKDATGAGGGLNWTDAFNTIRAAVRAATADNEIWVAEGTYTSTIDPVVNMKAGVHLYGGFAGTETLRDEDADHGAPILTEDKMPV